MAHFTMEECEATDFCFEPLPNADVGAVNSQLIQPMSRSMMKGFQRYVLSVSAVLALSIIFADSDGSTLNTEITVDIRSQSLMEALNDWARQSGMQLIVPDEGIFEITI